MQRLCYHICLIYYINITLKFGLFFVIILFSRKGMSVAYFSERVWHIAKVLEFYVDRADSSECGTYFPLVKPLGEPGYHYQKKLFKVNPVVIAVEFWGHVLVKKRFSFILTIKF